MKSTKFGIIAVTALLMWSCAQNRYEERGQP